MGRATAEFFNSWPSKKVQLLGKMKEELRIACSIGHGLIASYGHGLIIQENGCGERERASVRNSKREVGVSSWVPMCAHTCQITATTSVLSANNISLIYPSYISQAPHHASLAGPASWSELPGRKPSIAELMQSPIISSPVTQT